MPEESKDVSRKEPVAGKIHNSEEFADYVHAVSAPMKVAMAAIVVFFIGVIIFCIFGRVQVSISAAAVADSTGACTCYVKAADRNDIEPGDEVVVAGETYKIASISSEATSVDDSLDKYACQVGDLSVGDSVYLVKLDGTITQGVYEGTLIKGYLQPLDVLLAG